MLVSKSPDQASEEGHEQRCPHSFIDHIPDQETHPPSVSDRENIVKIACHLAGWNQAGSDPPAFQIRDRFGQEALLDPAPDLHFFFGSIN